MTVTGTNFGSDQSLIKVWLSNNTHPRVYEMKVLELKSTTEMVVGISGGLPETYSLHLTVNDEQATIGPDVGGIPANQFKYELDVLTVSPNEGSYYGGTLLTITGINFAPTLQENMVFIGNEVNWFCRIVTLSETQITCRTPPMHERYNVGDNNTVVVVSKLIQETKNTVNSTRFAYKETYDSPKLTSLSKTSGDEGDSITLTGDWAICGGNPL